MLLTELLADTNSMRDKYHEFSQFTEEKIAEFVLQRKSLQQQLEQRTQDLAVTNAQRAQIQAELVKSISLVTKLRTQRDKSRSRVRILESSRSYRLARRLRRVMPSFLRSK